MPSLRAAVSELFLERGLELLEEVWHTFIDGVLGAPDPIELSNLTSRIDQRSVKTDPAELTRRRIAWLEANCPLVQVTPGTDELIQLCVDSGGGATIVTNSGSAFTQWVVARRNWLIGEGLLVCSDHPSILPTAAFKPGMEPWKLGLRNIGARFCGTKVFVEDSLRCAIPAAESDYFDRGFLVAHNDDEAHAFEEGLRDKPKLARRLQVVRDMNEVCSILSA